MATEGIQLENKDEKRSGPKVPEDLFKGTFGPEAGIREVMTEGTQIYVGNLSQELDRDDKTFKALKELGDILPTRFGGDYQPNTRYADTQRQLISHARLVEVHRRVDQFEKDALERIRALTEAVDPSATVASIEQSRGLIEQHEKDMKAALTRIRELEAALDGSVEAAQAGTQLLDALKEIKAQQTAMASDIDEVKKKPACCTIM